MQAESSVELGAHDACLELPWQGADCRYYDLKRQPELLLQVVEAHHNRELGEFLASLNSPLSMLETAKCDTWLSNQLEEEEAVYQAAWKFACYVDLVFSERRARFSFAAHENFAQRVSRLLRRAPEISAAAEFILRRCYYHGSDQMAEVSACATEEGFCLTFYLFGYGDDEDEARRRWAIALKLVENALLQVSALHRRGSDQTAPPPREDVRVTGRSW